MPARKMHVDEVETDVSLVRRLLAAQFPNWAGLSIQRVPSAGTDNALYRLGEEMVVRLPRIDWATDQVEKEHYWLPKLAPLLPLDIPTPLVKGEPGEGYPWPWSIYSWLNGENVTIDQLEDPRQTALDLAGFIAVLQRCDLPGESLPEPHDLSRGQPLARRDPYTCEAIASLKGVLDLEAVTRVWEAALGAPAWAGRPVWLHGDLQSGNLLAVNGRLSAVIDFGCLGLGDPAYDIMAAWLFLSSETREVFRAALQVDDATWARARGLALSVGMIALPYYQTSNPALAGIARRAIDETLRDDSKSA